MYRKIIINKILTCVKRNAHSTLLMTIVGYFKTLNILMRRTLFLRHPSKLGTNPRVVCSWTATCFPRLVGGLTSLSLFGF